jgi:hypothetical protein
MGKSEAREPSPLLVPREERSPSCRFSMVFVGAPKALPRRERVKRVAFMVVKM